MSYENKVRHAGRQVKLTYMLVEAPAFEVLEDRRDGSDGCNGENVAAQTPSLSSQPSRKAIIKGTRIPRRSWLYLRKSNAANERMPV